MCILVVPEGLPFLFPEAALLLNHDHWDGQTSEGHDSQTFCHSTYADRQSDKSDWLRKQNELSAHMHAQETGPSHTLHSAATGDENERFLEETLNQNEILVNE